MTKIGHWKRKSNKRSLIFIPFLVIFLSLGIYLFSTQINEEESIELSLIEGTKKSGAPRNILNKHASRTISNNLVGEKMFVEKKRAYIDTAAIWNELTTECVNHHGEFCVVMEVRYTIPTSYSISYTWMFSKEIFHGFFYHSR